MRKTKRTAKTKVTVDRFVREGNELVVFYRDNDLYPAVFVAQLTGSEGVGKTVESAIRDVVRLHLRATRESHQ